MKDKEDSRRKQQWGHIIDGKETGDLTFISQQPTLMQSKCVSSQAFLACCPL